MRLFGSWRAALEAAGLEPLPRGRPSADRPRGATGPVRDPSDEVLFPCAVCQKLQNDLPTHILRAHLLTPRRYERAYGPLPDQRAVRLRVVAALREYVRAGGEPSAAELARRAPRLHDAVRRLGVFESVESALAFVTQTSTRREGRG